MDEDIIRTMVTLHSQHVGNGTPFQRKHLLEHDASLASRLDRQKIGWPIALAISGIDPRCHLGQFSYGQNDRERKATFCKFIKSLSEKHGVGSLNDSSMNSNQQIAIPDECWDTSFTRYFSECAQLGCQRMVVSKRSIYANGRRLFGDWLSAIKAAGLNPVEVVRKPHRLELEDIISDLDQFDLAHGSAWSMSTIKEKKSDLAKAIYNLRNRKSLNIPFSSVSKDIVYITWVNLMHWRENGVISENMDWYASSEPQLIAQFQKNHRAQDSWDEGSIILGIHAIYAKGPSVLRLSREDVSHRGTARDKTVWAALRQKRFRGTGLNESSWMKKSGILVHKLREKYQQIDERYSPEQCLEYFSKRMSESLLSCENRLTREFNSTYNPDFTNFMISRYGSWEKALEEHGLDPKFFSITVSKRTRRGYRFQKFVEEKLEAAGLRKVYESPKTNEFVANRSIKYCSHKIRCKPDFLFHNLIIDTKTGYHASQKPEQIIRYFDHVPNIIILTLNDSDRTEFIQGCPIRIMGFQKFQEQSQDILGIALSSDLSKELSNVLKQHPFWE